MICCTEAPCCAGTVQPEPPTPNGTEAEPPQACTPPKAFSQRTESTRSDISATEVDRKAREANLYKLDALVVGTPLAKVNLLQDEVTALEAEARRALQKGYSNFCQKVISREDVGKSEKDDGAHVFVALTPKVVTQWCSKISYPLLEFSGEDQQVGRPKLVSAFPAALVLADSEVPISLQFRVTALPSNKTAFTVGVAKWPGFKLYFGKGFGLEENSWGLQWAAEDGSPSKQMDTCCNHRLSKGDLVCITCDTWRGLATISLNGKEAGNFSIPGGGTYVLGATLSTGSILTMNTHAMNPRAG